MGRFDPPYQAHVEKVPPGEVSSRQGPWSLRGHRRCSSYERAAGRGATAAMPGAPSRGLPGICITGLCRFVFAFRANKKAFSFGFLELPTGTPGPPLSTSELAIIERQLENVLKLQVRGMVAAENIVDTPLAAELRAKLLDDYKETVFRPKIFADPPERFPGGWHEIRLKPNVEPHYQPPFPLYGERKEAMKKIAEEWLEAGKIERPSRFEGWAAATFPILKKNGKWRGIADERGLNARVQRDQYPLPNIEHILQRQGLRKLFTVLDLKDAFSQVGLVPSCRHLTTMHTPLGQMQSKVLPQGYTNSPPFFQRVMDRVYAPVQEIVDNYVDDGIVGTDMGNTEEDELRWHDEQLRLVLDELARNKLVLDASKCVFFARRIEFCGHVLEHGKRTPAPGKLMCVEKWPLPETISELRAFLGFANYYHTYIPKFAEIAAPLMEKLKVGREDGKKGSTKKVAHGPESRQAFIDLKAALLQGLQLFVLDPDRPFVLRVDASTRAIGAALEQLPPSSKDPPTKEDALAGKTRPVAFMSRKLTPGQAAKWPIKEKETYAVVSAIQKWGSWIELQPLLVLTNHKNIEYWATEILDSPTGPSGRQTRWHMLLSRFNVSVGYIPGRDNGIADIMSRWAYPAGEALRDVSIHGSPQDDEAMRAIIEQEKLEERECSVVTLEWPVGMLEKIRRTGQEVAVLTSTRRPRVLDLFAGNKSWTKYFERLGFECYTLDNQPRKRPTICVDILEFDMKQFPPKFFDIVVASPPCEEFSHAKTRAPRNMWKGDALVLRTLHIIEYLQPAIWLLENPRAYLSTRPYMRNIPFVDIDYCRFCGWGYKKSTRVWGSQHVQDLSPVLCDGNCENIAEDGYSKQKKHRQWLGGRGYQPNTQDKWRIPEEAIKYLLGSWEAELENHAELQSFVFSQARERNVQAVEHDGEGAVSSPPPASSAAGPPRVGFSFAPPRAPGERAPARRRGRAGRAPGASDAQPSAAPVEEPQAPVVEPPQQAPLEEPARAPIVEPQPPAKPPLPRESLPRLPDISNAPCETVFEDDWDDFYLQCPRFGNPWRSVHDSAQEWPPGTSCTRKGFFRRKALRALEVDEKSRVRSPPGGGAYWEPAPMAPNEAPL